MQFRKYSASPSLRPFIEHFWTLESTEKESNSTFRLVPDGMVDWIFHFGQPWQYSFGDNADFISSSNMHVFGQLSNFVDVKVDEMDVLGVKFHPAISHRLWNLDMHYLTDRFLPLNDLGIGSTADT